MKKPSHDYEYRGTWEDPARHQSRNIGRQIDRRGFKVCSPDELQMTLAWLGGRTGNPVFLAAKKAALASGLIELPPRKYDAILAFVGSRWKEPPITVPDPFEKAADEAEVLAAAWKSEHLACAAMVAEHNLPGDSFDGARKALKRRLEKRRRQRRVAARQAGTGAA